MGWNLVDPVADRPDEEEKGQATGSSPVNLDGDSICVQKNHSIT